MSLANKWTRKEIPFFSNLALEDLSYKAELLLLKLIHLFAGEVLLVKKLEIEETETN